MSDTPFLAVCGCLVSSSSGLCRDDIVEWVSRALSKIIGMEVYWQNYTVQVPVASSSKVEETWEREWEGRREGRGAERERERGICSTSCSVHCCRKENFTAGMYMEYGELVGLPLLRHWC